MALGEILGFWVHSAPLSAPLSPDHSQAALNMVAKSLSHDLKEEGVAVGIVHPGM